jgi:hypothetical protein
VLLLELLEYSWNSFSRALKKPLKTEKVFKNSLITP